MFHQAISDLRGGEVVARDGHLGSLEDIYVDHHSWQVRYLVVATRRSRMLVSCACVSGGRLPPGRLKVQLSRSQLERGGGGAWSLDAASHWLDGRRLCSGRLLVGLAVQAHDGVMGHLADLLVDDDAWCIDYLLVDVAAGRRILVPLDWVSAVDLEYGRLRVSRTREELYESPTM